MEPFGALADPVRRALLQRLARGPARVVDLTAEHDISRPAISRHLRVLGEAGLVAAEDVGRERHYRLVAEGLHPVRAWLDQVTVVAGPRVPEHVLDALDLEVRRTGRDRAQTSPSHRHTQETG
ncbi:metalloregulator ArsR/SmtB family transcription factor [Ornithinimicrobium sp. F0845]|uniref:ArsR/SmtB family transcription factor n=1 Tax=Ornithinimicrobium sp. F0845 TaxID=2926412 RepID=UPI001FF34725|nr:metalloregulator ArsR/SmtB family transcription factor [Ornithinimicrobium sp. F0845]